MKIDNKVKRLITTMQIMQFLVGASFATAHLFVSYTVPVAFPYTVVSAVEAIVSEISAAASAITEDPGAVFASATSSVAAAVATATLDLDKHAWFKKLAFRAAGFEGLAEAVRDKHGETFGLEHDTRPLVDALRRIEKPKFIEEIKYRTEYQDVHCLDTDGQAFAIWLNVVYLLPLTFLFLRFFVKTYIWGTTSARGGKKARTASDSAVIAAKKASRFIEHLGTEAEIALSDAVDELDAEFGLKEKTAEIKREIQDVTKDWNAEDAMARIRQDFSNMKHNPEVEEILGRLQEAYAKTSQKLHVKEIVHGLEERASQFASDVSAEASTVKGEVQETFSKDNMEDSMERVKREVDEAVTGTLQNAQEVGQKVEKKGKELEAKLQHEYESGGESSRAELTGSPTKGSRIPTASSSSSSSSNKKKGNHHKHHGHGQHPGQGSPTASVTYANVADPTLSTERLHKA